MNGKIYKLVDNTNNNIYIGSTCETILTNLLNKHKSDYKRYVEKGIKYTTSFEIIKNNNYKIELIEEIICVNKYILDEREKYWIENINCINKYKPNNYLDKGNKDIHRTKKCNCGGEYKFGQQSKHYKTITHIHYILLKENI